MDERTPFLDSPSSTVQTCCLKICFTAPSPKSGSEVQVRYKQTQEKGRDFWGIIVGSAGFINLPVLRKFRPLFHFFSDTFLKPTQHSKQCIRQHSFCATAVSRVGTDLKPARNPQSHKARAGQ